MIENVKKQQIMKTRKQEKAKKLGELIGSIIVSIWVPFLYFSGKRFRKTIYDQKRQWGLMWWIFGGTVNYNPSIVLKNGNRLSGECKPPIWERIYNGSSYLVRKLTPIRDSGMGQREHLPPK